MSTEKEDDRRRFRKRLLAWYDKAKRPLPWRNTKDTYRIWTSEVMLQQTRVETVLSYFDSFLGRFPDIRALGTADAGAVLKAWEGLGYYARARNFHRAAGIVLSRYGGVIPADPETLRELPGVGPYIAAAVASIAFNRPVAVVDGNVKRVLARRLKIDTPVGGPSAVYTKSAGRLLALDRPGDYNQAIMELGALICKPGPPRCAECPVTAGCKAYATGETSRYPRKSPKAQLPRRRGVAALLWSRGCFLIVRRPENGLLGGLWDLPGGFCTKSEKPRAALVRTLSKDVGLSDGTLIYTGTVRHVFTHFRLEITLFTGKAAPAGDRANSAGDRRWIRPADISAYAFPKTAHKLFSLVDFGANEMVVTKP